MVKVFTKLATQGKRHDQVHDQIYDQVHNQIHDQVHDQIYDQSKHAAEQNQLVGAIRQAHRQSSGGRLLVRMVFKVLLFKECGASRFFCGD